MGKTKTQAYKTLIAMATYNAEGALLEFTEQVVKAMEAQGLKRSAVARRLRTTKGRITQLLDGPNITFRTAAKLAQAVGLKFKVVLEWEGKVQ